VQFRATRRPQLLYENSKRRVQKHLCGWHRFRSNSTVTTISNVGYRHGYRWYELK